MYLLAFETSFGKFSISLFHDDKLIANYASENENDQAERLIPCVEETLSNNNITYADLDYIAVGTGPGSFTGVRIGLAAAKGMAIACQAKLIGVSSMEASAHKSGSNKVYLNASRGEAFYQEFPHEAILIPYIGEFSPLPDAESIGRVALTRLDSNLPVAPLYVRKPDAKFKLRAASINDVALLAQIHAECFPKPWNEKIIAESIQNSEVLMAENLGFIIFQAIADECEVKTIAVTPKFQGKGVGLYLAQKMLEICKSNNIKKIFLEVEETNNPACGLYNKLGFKEISSRKNYYGENRHALMMQLNLL